MDSPGDRTDPAPAGAEDPAGSGHEAEGLPPGNLPDDGPASPGADPAGQPDGPEGATDPGWDRHSTDFLSIARRWGETLLRPAPIVCVEPVWRHLWTVLLLAAVARIAVALTGDFILHPDEIYQYLEPAHGVVFGNALTSWEFVFGARPFHIAGFVAGILFVLDWVGLGTPDYYIPVVKVVFCLVSLGLPVAMYFAARALWGERTAVVALLLGCFWYELVGFAHKPLSDMVSSYLIMGGMALMLDRRRTDLRIAAGTFLLVLAFGVRYQTVTLTGFFCLFLMAALTARQNVVLLLSGLASLAVVGVLDHIAWGGFFHSILTNLAVNVELNNMGDPGGQASDIHFFLWFAWASVGVFWVVIGAALLTPRRYLLLLALLAVFLASHTLLIHKEYRFGFPWIPLWLLIASDLVARAMDLLKDRPWRRIAAGTLAASLFAGISVAGIANRLPAQDELYLGYSHEHTKVNFLKPDPHLQVYRRLSREGDMASLLENARPLSSSGGYYYLHRKIPLYGPDYLVSLAYQYGRPTTQPQWFTHAITPSSQYLGDEYEVEFRTSNLLVWGVKPDERVPIFQLANHRFSPDMHSVMEGLPALKRFYPEDEDYTIRLIVPKPPLGQGPPPKSDGP